MSWLDVSCPHGDGTRLSINEIDFHMTTIRLEATYHFQEACGTTPVCLFRTCSVDAIQAYITLELLLAVDMRNNWVSIYSKNKRCHRPISLKEDRIMLLPTLRSCRAKAPAEPLAAASFLEDQCIHSTINT